MDFHAWFEVYLEGAWRTFDARHNYPRTGRVAVARGRDAVDVAFATMFGYAELIGFTIWAEQVSDDAQLGYSENCPARVGSVLVQAACTTSDCIFW